ncbi:unnamed protein product, partial [Vitis vinifera]|uniref:Uncharacterized protein n=1 Tax=Vitis vinifera TaxID=29760 RepID=D7UB59_VITVI
MFLTTRLGFSPFLLSGMSSSSDKYHTSNSFVTIKLPFIKSPLNPLSYLSAISPPKSNGDSNELEEEMH